MELLKIFDVAVLSFLSSMFKKKRHWLSSLDVYLPCPVHLMRLNYLRRKNIYIKMNLCNFSKCITAYLTNMVLKAIHLCDVHAFL